MPPCLWSGGMVPPWLSLLRSVFSVPVVFCSQTSSKVNVVIKDTQGKLTKSRREWK